MDYVFFSAIVLLSSLAVWAGFRLSFFWTTKFCNRRWPTFQTDGCEDREGVSFNDALDIGLSRMKVSIAAYGRLKEVSEIDEETRECLAKPAFHLYKKHQVVDALRRKLTALMEFFSDLSSDRRKAVASLPNPLICLYQSLPVGTEILLEDVLYHEGYNLGIPNEEETLAFHKQVTVAIERLLTLFAKAEYESGFDEIVKDWGTASLLSHNWRTARAGNKCSKTRYDFRRLMVELLENRLSENDFVEQWENGKWEPESLADIGYFIAFIRRLFRRQTTSADQAPFAVAMARLREFYTASPELRQVFQPQMWATRITPQVLGTIAMVHAAHGAPDRRE